MGENSKRLSVMLQLQLELLTQGIFWLWHFVSLCPARTYTGGPVWQPAEAAPQPYGVHSVTAAGSGESLPADTVSRCQHEREAGCLHQPARGSHTGESTLRPTPECKPAQTVCRGSFVLPYQVKMFVKHLYELRHFTKFTFAVYLSRCGSRIGGQSFVKVRGAPRSPETTVWRRRHITARQEKRKSVLKTNKTSPHYILTAASCLTAVLLLLLLLMWIKLPTNLSLLQTLMLHSVRSDFTLLHFSPSWHGRATSTHLTSRL